jgi:hypothetical protein
MTTQKNHNTLTIASATLALALLAFTFYKYHHPAPTPDVVNGIYANSCCRDVMINGTYVKYGSETARIRLIDDKFGLVGYLDRPLGPLFRSENGRRAPVVLVFTGRDGFTVIDYSGKNLAFKRRRSQ